MKISYQDAIKELADIEEGLKSGQISLDDLEEMVKRAHELLQFCQLKLRTTEEELDKLWREDD